MTLLVPEGGMEPGDVRAVRAWFSRELGRLAEKHGDDEAMMARIVTLAEETDAIG